MSFARHSTSLGLSKNEQQVYKMLLLHGDMRVSEISERTEIHRRNVYDVLGRLAEKGLTIETLGRREVLYSAVDPNKLLELAEERRELLENGLERLNALFRAPSKRQSVHVLRGIEGYKRLQQAMLRERQEVCSFASKAPWLDPALDAHTRRFFLSLKRVGIRSRTLCDAALRSDLASDGLREYRFLPADITPPGGFEIFGSHVGVISRQQPKTLRDDFVCTVIVNAQLAESFRSWFQLIWDSVGTGSR